MLWKRGEIAPKEQFLLFSTIFCYLFLDFHVKNGTRNSVRDKRLFEISEIEITTVDCILYVFQMYQNQIFSMKMTILVEGDSNLPETLLNQPLLQ